MPDATITASDLRRQLGLALLIVGNGERIVIMRRGQAIAALMPIADFEVMTAAEAPAEDWSIVFGELQQV